MNYKINKNVIYKDTKIYFCIIAVMLSVFCSLKVLRGGDTETIKMGGIWNYISLLYYPFVLIITFFKKFRKIDFIFISSFFYILFALISTFGNLNFEVNLYEIYQILMIPYPILVFWAFYFCSKKSYYGENIILIGYMICLILNFYFIIRFYFGGANQAMESDIYFSLGLFPFALQLLKNRKLQMLVITLQFLCVFMVNKRTALISFIIGIIVYMILINKNYKKRNIIKSFKSLIIIVTLIILFYFIGKYIDNKYNMKIYYRLFRIIKDNGSGRGNLYKNIWIEFINAPLLKQIFGHGINTAGKIGGFEKAHNDFLEIIYDFGVITFIFALTFYFLIIKKLITLIKVKSPYAPSFAFSVVLGLFLAMFSYFLVFYTYVTCIMAFWGYSLCMEKIRLFEIKNKRRKLLDNN